MKKQKRTIVLDSSNYKNLSKESRLIIEQINAQSNMKDLGFTFFLLGKSWEQKFFLYSCTGYTLSQHELQKDPV